MTSIKAITGGSTVYHSSEAQGFQDTEHYPVAWEFIFVNDAAGKVFAENIENAFARLPKKKGYIMGFDGKDSDAARCVECVFQDQHTFRKILNESLVDMVIYDEQQAKVIPKQEMVDQAIALTKETVLAV